MLPLAQQLGDLLGLQQPGDADEVEFLIGAGFGQRAELVAVEHDHVEGRL